MIEFAAVLEDNDGGSGDSYYLNLEKSVNGATVTWGNVVIAQHNLALYNGNTGGDKLIPMSFIYTVSDVSDDRLAFKVVTVGGASSAEWEGRLLVKVTKIG